MNEKIVAHIKRNMDEALGKEGSLKRLCLLYALQPCLHKAIFEQVEDINELTKLMLRVHETSGDSEREIQTVVKHVCKYYLGHLNHPLMVASDSLVTYRKQCIVNELQDMSDRRAKLIDELNALDYEGYEYHMKPSATIAPRVDSDFDLSKWNSEP